MNGFFKHVVTTVTFTSFALKFVKKKMFVGKKRKISNEVTHGYIIVCNSYVNGSEVVVVLIKFDFKISFL